LTSVAEFPALEENFKFLLRRLGVKIGSY